MWGGARSERSHGRDPNRWARRSVSVLAWFLAPLGLIVACSAFEAEDVPAQSGDASNGGGDADALVDSSQSSGDVSPDSALNDGGSEASPVEASTPVCVGAHWLCDNFDQMDSKLTMTSGDTWTETLVGGATTITTDLTAPSLPNVLKVATDSSTRAWFSVTRSAAISGLHCKARMKVVQVGSADSIAFEILLFNSTENYRASVMTASGGGALVSHGGVVGGSTLSPSPAPVPLTAWTQIDILLKVGSNAEIAAFMNGDVVFSSPLGSVNFVPTQASFTIGSSVYAGAPQSWVHLFDDVVCDSIP